MVILVLVLVLVMVAVLVMIPGKAGKDHRVKFLAPGIAGWDLGEERGSWEAFPWDYARCWERIPHVAVTCGYHGASSPTTVGLQQGTGGPPPDPIFPPQLY